MTVCNDAGKHFGQQQLFYMYYRNNICIVLYGRPPGKTRLLLEEVLVRPAGVLALWSVCVLMS